MRIFAAGESMTALGEFHPARIFGGRANAGIDETHAGNPVRNPGNERFDRFP
jgi:hypothetical protein